MYRRVNIKRSYIAALYVLCIVLGMITTDTATDVIVVGNSLPQIQ